MDRQYGQDHGARLQNWALAGPWLGGPKIMVVWNSPGPQIEQIHHGIDFGLEMPKTRFLTKTMFFNYVPFIFGFLGVPPWGGLFFPIGPLGPYGAGGSGEAFR